MRPPAVYGRPRRRRRFLPRSDGAGFTGAPITRAELGAARLRFVSRCEWKPGTKEVPDAAPSADNASTRPARAAFSCPTQLSGL